MLQNETMFTCDGTFMCIEENKTQKKVSWTTCVYNTRCSCDGGLLVHQRAE